MYNETEDISPFVKENLKEQLASAIGNRSLTAVPPPPKRGEYIICQHCGKVMKPEDFSKNPAIRKKEFKWHLHHQCQQAMLDMCDKQTLGLLSQRNKKY